MIINFKNSGHHESLLMLVRGFFFLPFPLTEHLDAHYHQYIHRLLLFTSHKALLGYAE